MDESNPPLAKLPPLPKKRTRRDDANDRRAENLRDLPAINSEWGSLDVGGWAEENRGGVLTIVGRCARCGDVKDAVELKLVRRPFGRGEEYRCDECINEPKETEDA